MKARTLVITLIVILLVVTGTQADVPAYINFAGTLSDSTGSPLNETVTIQFSIFADSTGGSALWNETQASVEVADGIFNLYLGSLTPMSTVLFDGSERWLEMIVDSETLVPRQLLSSVPYGFRTEEADHATTADTADIALTSTPDNDWTIDADTIYHENGNVGIGTTTPSAKLDV